MKAPSATEPKAEKEPTLADLFRSAGLKFRLTTPKEWAKEKRIANREEKERDDS